MNRDTQSILDELHSLANPANVAGMAHFGINSTNTLGISNKELHRIAKGLHDHQLALELWDSGVHEARFLATLVDIPSQVTREQMEDWVVDINSWDICDGVCGNLFDKTPFAVEKAREWILRDEEYVKRAGFVTMAWLAVHDKKADDSLFLEFLTLIEAHADDERNFVKKAVNWALRQIGKRNDGLKTPVLEVCYRLLHHESRAARWAAKDAIKELEARK